MKRTSVFDDEQSNTSIFPPTIGNQSRHFRSISGGSASNVALDMNQRASPTMMRENSYETNLANMARSRSPSPTIINTGNFPTFQQPDFYPSAFPSISTTATTNTIPSTAPTTNTTTTTTGGITVDANGVVIDEIPLLEELGINFSEIWKKTKFVLNPFRRVNKGFSSQDYKNSSTSEQLMDDKDLAGALLFALALGFVLLLRGKVHFGYIYGVGTMGCLGMYLLLNLISPQGIEIQRVVSVLGYSLLPMVFLAISSTFIPLFITPTVWSITAMILVLLFVMWSTTAATSLLVLSLKMYHQKWIFAYPISLLYMTFALIILF